MPNTSLDQAIKEAYASAPVDTVILHTLELRHPSFIDSNDDPVQLRVVLDNRDWTARLENNAPIDGGQFVNFIGYSFNIELPPLEESASPTLKITLDNVSQEFQQNIAYASVSQELTEITYRPYLNTDVDGSGRLQYPQMNPPLNLNVNSVIATPSTIIINASFADMANKGFPTQTYTTDRFPGLLR